MESTKIKVKTVTLAYVAGSYLLFLGGLVCMSYAIYNIVFLEGNKYDGVAVLLGFVLGVIGLAKGGRVVYGQKFIRRPR